MNDVETNIKILDEFKSFLERINDKLIGIGQYIETLDASLKANIEPTEEDKENITKIELLLTQYRNIEKKLFEKINKKDITEHMLKKIATDLKGELTALDYVIKELDSLTKAVNRVKLFEKVILQLKKDEKYLQKSVSALLVDIQNIEERLK